MPRSNDLFLKHHARFADEFLGCGVEYGDEEHADSSAEDLEIDGLPVREAGNVLHKAAGGVIFFDIHGCVALGAIPKYGW